MKNLIQMKRNLMDFFRKIFLLSVALKPKDPEAYRIGKWSHGSLKRKRLDIIFPHIKDIVDEIKILNPFDRMIGTSLDTLEMVILASIVKYTNSNNILEIGTYDGNTALNIAANSSSDAKIFTVDLPLEWDGLPKIKVPENYFHIPDRSITGRQFKNTIYEKKITQILCDSAALDYDALPLFDLIFIDGCHFYEYVKNDTFNAMKHVKKGGSIIWHDYGQIRHVSKAVDEVKQEMSDICAISGTRFAVGIKK